MPPKKQGKSKLKGQSSHKKEPKPPSTPQPAIIRPNVYEIFQRRLKREKAVRTAAWLLYPDSPSYVKDLKLEDPVEKKEKKPKKSESKLIPAALNILRLPTLPTIGANLIGLSGLSEADAAKAKKVLLFNFNMKEFEVKPEEEAWIEGEPLGDSDSEDDHGPLRKYVTSTEEMQTFREKYVVIGKRRAAQMALGNLEQPSKVNVAGKGNIGQGVSKVSASRTVLPQLSTVKLPLPLPEVSPSVNLTRQASAVKNVGRAKSINPAVA